MYIVIGDKMVREKENLEEEFEGAYFTKNVKNRNDKMTLKELILKGEGTFNDYRYFLPSGTEVEPRITLNIRREFKNLEEFIEYIKSIIGEIKEIGYSVLSIPNTYNEGSVHCRMNTPVRVVKELYLNGFTIGWGGEIYVRCKSKNMRYVRSVDKIIVVKKDGVKN